MKKIVPLLFILIILGIIYFTLFSTVFKIKSLSSSPVDCASSDDIRKVVNLLGVNFFLLDAEVISKKIKDKFFCIGYVNLKRSIPDKVTLELKGRSGVFNLIPYEAISSSDATPSAQVIATDSGFLVDEEGVIFAKANFETRLQPILFSGETLSIGERLGGELISKISQVLETLKSLGIYPFGAKIYSIPIESGSSDNFSVGQKPQTTFKLNDSLDRQLASLQLILNQARIDTKEVEFIDLRFDKPVVKYGKGQSNLRN